MSQRPIKKVKVHRVYKNFISIAMILVGAAIIALMVMNMSGFGTVSLTSFLKDKINDLSNKVANGKDYNQEALDAKELEELNQPVLTFVSNFDSSAHDNEMIYFRSASFGDWNSANDEFTKPVLYTPTNNISPLAFFADKALNNSQKYSMQIKLSSYMDKKFALDYSSFATQAKNDCYFSATSKKETSYKMDFAPTYDYTQARNNSFSNSEYENAERLYRAHVYKNYLNVDATLKSRLEKFLADNSLSKDSPTIIDDVANFLQTNYVYDLNVPSSNGEDNVIFFLENSKRGICNNFAAASSMMYRTLGIPARFVTGFLSKSLGGEEEQELHMQSAHAWTEVYIDGSGWYKIDTTSNRLDIDYPENYVPDSPNIPNPDAPNDNQPVLPSISFNGRYQIYYDGLSHSPAEDADDIVTVSNLPEGYTYTTKFSNNVVDLVDAGYYTYLVEVRIFDSSGNNVTNKLISGITGDALKQGPFVYEILPRPVIFISDDAEYTLGDSSAVLNETKVTNEFNFAGAKPEVLEKMDNVNVGVVARDYYVYEFDNRSFSAKGNYRNTFTLSILNEESDENESRNYSISYRIGEINVV